MNKISLEQARAAIPQATEAFERLCSVAGVGLVRLGNGYAIKVNLRGEPAPGTILPKTIDDVPIVVEIVGRIRAL